MKCASCGTENDEGILNCSSCGHPLAPAISPSDGLEKDLTRRARKKGFQKMIAFIVILAVLVYLFIPDTKGQLSWFTFILGFYFILWSVRLQWGILDTAAYAFTGRQKHFRVAQTAPLRVSPVPSSPNENSEPKEAEGLVKPSTSVFVLALGVLGAIMMVVGFFTA